MISRAQGEALFVALYMDDVRANPSHYKASVRDNPRAHALAITEGLSRAEVGRMLKELRVEIFTVRKHA